MASNGRLPASDLADIPGGRLRKDAARSWLAMRQHIGRHDGVWICPTSPRTAYRPYADQEYFWNLYTAGRGALAARPGTSNHGWGIAVDLPTPAMQAAVRKHGHLFGWGIRGGRLPSDAPSESWHSTYHPGRYAAVTASEPKPRKHPRSYLTDAEKAARDTLVKERRIAKRNGGWDKIDASHRERAGKAKALLARQLKAIRAEKDQDKNNRRRRAAYIRELIG